MFPVTFKGVLRAFKGCFKDVSRVFQYFQGVLKKFHVAWHSSQLPEQKEGLFKKGPVLGIVGHIPLPLLESRINRNH